MHQPHSGNKDGSLEAMMKCTGCSKHCCEDAPKCKYGRTYFAKMRDKQEQENPKQQYKWERNLTRGSLIWQMLMVNRRMKKAVCKGRITEEALIAALTLDEYEMLHKALDRLSAAIPAEK